MADGREANERAGSLKWRAVAAVAVLAIAGGMVFAVMDQARAAEVAVTPPGTVSNTSGAVDIIVTLTVPDGQRMPLEAVRAVVERELNPTGGEAKTSSSQPQAVAAQRCPAPIAGCPSGSPFDASASLGTAITAIRLDAAYVGEVADGYRVSDLGYSAYGGTCPCELTLAGGYGYSSGAGYGYGGAVGAGPVTESSGYGYGYAGDDLILRFAVTIDPSGLAPGQHWFTFIADTGSAIIGSLSSPAVNINVVTGGGGGGGPGGGGGGGPGGGGGGSGGGGSGGDPIITGISLSGAFADGATLRLNASVSNADRGDRIVLRPPGANITLFWPVSADSGTVRYAEWAQAPPGAGALGAGVLSGGFFTLSVDEAPTSGVLVALVGATVKAADMDGDGEFSIGDVAYIKTSGAPVAVSVGDVRLTPRGALPSREAVIAGDSDVNDFATVPSDAGHFQPGAWRLLDLDGSGTWTPGDGVYIDGDQSDSVSATDVRIAPVLGLAPARMVQAEDADVGLALTGPSPFAALCYLDLDSSGAYEFREPVLASAGCGSPQGEQDLVLAPGLTVDKRFAMGSAEADRIQSGSMVLLKWNGSADEWRHEDRWFPVETVGANGTFRAASTCCSSFASSFPAPAPSGGGGGGGGGGTSAISARAMVPRDGAAAEYHAKVWATAGKEVLIKTASPLLPEVAFTTAFTLHGATVEVVHWPPDAPPATAGILPPGADGLGFITLTVSTGGESHMVALTITPGADIAPDRIDRLVLMKWDGGAGRWNPVSRVLVEASGGELRGQATSLCCSDFAVAADVEPPHIAITQETRDDGGIAVRVESSDNVGTGWMLIHAGSRVVANTTAASHAFVVPGHQLDGSAVVRIVAADFAGNAAEESVALDAPAEPAGTEESTGQAAAGPSEERSSLWWGLALALVAAGAVAAAVAYRRRYRRGP